MLYAARVCVFYMHLVCRYITRNARDAAAAVVVVAIRYDNIGAYYTASRIYVICVFYIPTHIVPA